MKLRRLKYVIIVVVAGLLVIGVWGIATKLVDIGGSSEDRLSEKVEEDNKVNAPDTDEEEYVRIEQEGTYEDKAVQCVYEFFINNLPGVDIEDKEYEVKDIGEDNYCVHIGDWYVFVKGEYDLCYPYRISKTSELTDEERKFVEDNDLVLVEKEGRYTWDQ